LGHDEIHAVITADANEGVRTENVRIRHRGFSHDLLGQMEAKQQSTPS
jgi:hypothetical protein